MKKTVLALFMCAVLLVAGCSRQATSNTQPNSLPGSGAPLATDVERGLLRRASATYFDQNSGVGDENGYYCFGEVAVPSAQDVNWQKQVLYTDYGTRRQTQLVNPDIDNVYTMEGDTYDCELALSQHNLFFCYQNRIEKLERDGSNRTTLLDLGTKTAAFGNYYTDDVFLYTLVSSYTPTEGGEVSADMINTQFVRIDIATGELTTLYDFYNRSVTMLGCYGREIIFSAAQYISPSEFVEAPSHEDAPAAPSMGLSSAPEDASEEGAAPSEMEPAPVEQDVAESTRSSFLPAPLPRGGKAGVQAPLYSHLAASPQEAASTNEILAISTDSYVKRSILRYDHPSAVPILGAVLNGNYYYVQDNDPLLMRVDLTGGILAELDVGPLEYIAASILAFPEEHRLLVMGFDYSVDKQVVLCYNTVGEYATAMQLRYPLADLYYERYDKPVVPLAEVGAYFLVTHDTVSIPVKSEAEEFLQYTREMQALILKEDYWNSVPNYIPIASAPTA